MDAKVRDNLQEAALKRLEIQANSAGFCSASTTLYNVKTACKQGSSSGLAKHAENEAGLGIPRPFKREGGSISGLS